MTDVPPGNSGDLFYNKISKGEFLKIVGELQENFVYNIKMLKFQ
jgi:hypothetical protein